MTVNLYADIMFNIFINTYIQMCNYTDISSLQSCRSSLLSELVNTLNLYIF